MGNIPRRRSMKKVEQQVASDDTITLPTVYSEDPADPLYMPPALRRTVMKVAYLPKRQREEYYRNKNGAG